MLGVHLGAPAVSAQMAPSLVFEGSLAQPVATRLRTALLEPGVPSTSGVSDLITLSATQSGNNMASFTASFQSDPTTEVPLLPGNASVFITETGALQPIFNVGISIAGVPTTLTVSAQSGLEAVPEPSTAVLFAFASIGTAGALWRRYRCS